jgi:hypothetical protein
MNAVELQFPGGPVSLEGFAVEKGPTSRCTPWDSESAFALWDVLSLASKMAAAKAVYEDDDADPTAQSLARQYLGFFSDCRITLSNRVRWTQEEGRL